MSRPNTYPLLYYQGKPQYGLWDFEQFNSKPRIYTDKDGIPLEGTVTDSEDPRHPSSVIFENGYPIQADIDSCGVRLRYHFDGGLPHTNWADGPTHTFLDSNWRAFYNKEGRCVFSAGMTRAGRFSVTVDGKLTPEELANMRAAGFEPTNKKYD